MDNAIYCIIQWNCRQGLGGLPPGDWETVLQLKWSPKYLYTAMTEDINLYKHLKYDTIIGRLLLCVSVSKCNLSSKTNTARGEHGRKKK